MSGGWKSRGQGAGSREQGAGSRKGGAGSGERGREQRADSREQGAESNLFLAVLLYAGESFQLLIVLPAALPDLLHVVVVDQVDDLKMPG